MDGYVNELLKSSSDGSAHIWPPTPNPTSAFKQRSPPPPFGINHLCIGLLRF